MTVRILLADDHALVRGGIRRILEAEPDLTVLAEAAELRSRRRGAGAEMLLRLPITEAAP